MFRIPSDIDLQGPLSVSRVFKTCGTPGCRCKKGEPHGPYPVLSYRSVEGKHRQRILDKATADLLRLYIAEVRGRKRPGRSRAESPLEKVVCDFLGMHHSQGRYRERRDFPRELRWQRRWLLSPRAQRLWTQATFVRLCREDWKQQHRANARGVPWGSERFWADAAAEVSDAGENTVTM